MYVCLTQRGGISGGKGVKEILKLKLLIVALAMTSHLINVKSLQKISSYDNKFKLYTPYTMSVLHQSSKWRMAGARCPMIMSREGTMMG